MKKEKKLKIILPILVITSIFVWTPNLKIFSNKDGKSMNNKDALSGSVADDLLLAIRSRSKTKEVKISAYKNWGRNPFVLKYSAEDTARQTKLKEESTYDTALEDIVLNGIFWNKKKPGALLNDQVVGIGSQVGQYTVSQIYPNSVTVEDRGNTYKLTLRDEDE